MNTRAPTLADALTRAPHVHDPALARRHRSELLERIAADPALGGLAALLEKPSVDALMQGVFGASAYLTGLVLRRPEQLLATLQTPAPARLVALDQRLDADMATASSLAEAMRALRLFKADAALFLALADLGGIFPDVDVARGIAAAADASVRAAVAFLFRQAQARGDWLDTAPAAEARSGYMVVAMGKHGANELNYSSDIDLIVFYDPARAQLAPRHEVQHFLVRLTRDLVRLLQERTEHGYVFRTDLRLRPDPGAMPLAIGRDTALNYYESFGQNWERAAMIKARAIAGDVTAGESLLGELQPFIWRKYLDYAAIADIHAMKRQIHAAKGFGDIRVAGHNIKLGRGGIREIEFFTQTQQLIAGGRQPDQRAPETLVALRRLATRGWIAEPVRSELAAAYVHLRTIEHRLQMLDDEQTQTLPETAAGLERLAHFSGYADTASFAAALTATLETVQRHYARLFEKSPDLTAGGANMVFAGEADDPATVAALGEMGYETPAQVIAFVRGWHHGRYRAIRSPRARELLTEVQPLLIAALARTADPNEAIAAFDGFRVDVLWHIVKAEGLPDNPLNPDWTSARTERDRVIQLYSTDQPEAHAIAADMRALADSYGDRVLIGEIFLPNDRHARWYGTHQRPEVHLPFNFQLIENDWNAAALVKVIADYEASLPEVGWPNWVFGSHDAPRIAARIGEAQARVAAMLLLTLRGTPTLYQGDELGIGKVDIPPDRIRDPQHFRQPTLDIGRDRSRTPMPWDASPNAGFSTGAPWLPLNADWLARNVAAQDADPRSLLSLYRRLLALRRATAALVAGDYVAASGDRDVLAYERRHAGDRLLIALNLSAEPRRLILPPGTQVAELLASTLDARPYDGILRGDEGCILRLSDMPA